jgi:hypothetical protein
MKSFAGLICCCLLIGAIGQLQTAPAELMSSATAATRLPPATNDQGVIGSIPIDLASLKRPDSAGGGCAAGCCPAATTAPNVAATEATDEGGRKHRIVGAVASVGKSVRGLLGHDRRVARRSARRGG